MDSDDVKPTRGKTRSWIKQVSVSGYSNNIIRKLKIKDRMRFKEIFRMSVEDVEFVVKHMDDNCFFENMCKYLIDITGDAWWMKTIFKLIQHENHVGWAKKMFDEILFGNKVCSPNMILSFFTDFESV